MQVTITFNFPDIVDPNSPEADAIIETLTAQTVEWQAEWRALPPQSKTRNTTVWLDEAATQE